MATRYVTPECVVREWSPAAEPQDVALGPSDVAVWGAKD